jgi:ADP-heptose:LPS heptosyltransferase
MFFKYKFVNLKTKIIIFFVDIVGFIIWAAFHIFIPWRIVNRKPMPSSPQKVLLIRADYIGDVLLTTHTLKAIRKSFPEADITFLVSQKSREILEGNPYIDDIIAYDPPWFFRDKCRNTPKNCLKNFLNILSVIRKQRFDLAVDFRGDVRNILFFMVFTGIPHRVSFAASGGWYLLTKIAPYKSNLHEADYHSIIAETIGAPITQNALPEIFINNKHRATINRFLYKHKLRSADILIVIHPGARKSVKLWPKERYAIIGNYLISKYGAKIILTGSNTELPLLEEVKTLMNGQALISTYEIKNLLELTALLERCNLYIGVSSGPSHIAGTVRLPSVLIFGPETIPQWKPIGNKHVIIKKDFPCCPCNMKNCTLDETCIKAISVNDVIDGIEEIMEH